MIQNKKNKDIILRSVLIALKKEYFFHRSSIWPANKLFKIYQTDSRETWKTFPHLQTLRLNKKASSAISKLFTISNNISLFLTVLTSCLRRGFAFFFALTHNTSNMESENVCSYKNRFEFIFSVVSNSLSVPSRVSCKYLNEMQLEITHHMRR